MRSVALQKELSAALVAAKAATNSLQANFKRNRQGAGAVLKTWMKSPGALVTEADIAADKATVESLNSSDVDAALISEESTSGDSSSDSVWLIDPLCGTVPFRAGMPHWGVNIALRQRNRLSVGVITLPHSGQVLAATAGRGVTLNGKPFEGRDPGLPLNESIVGLETGGGEKWSRLFGTEPDGVSQISWPGSVSYVNTFASAAYPLALVATGGMSGVVFHTVDPVHLPAGADTVHVAAGALIAQELGVIVSDAHGEPLDWLSDETYPVIVVAWPSVHSKLIQAMRERA